MERVCESTASGGRDSGRNELLQDVRLQGDRDPGSAATIQLPPQTAGDEGGETSTAPPGTGRA